MRWEDQDIDYSRPIPRRGIVRVNGAVVVDIVMTVLLTTLVVLSFIF